MRNKLYRKTVSIIMCVVLCISAAALLSESAFAAGAPTGAGYVSTSGGRLNVRSGAGTQYGVITALTNKSRLTVYSAENGFYYAEYADGSFGWCSKNYVTLYDGAYPATVNITSGYLNVRSAPAASAPVADKLYSGDYVTVRAVTYGWASIIYNGNFSGYVSNAYLRTISTQTNNNITLNVPSFKQTDPRWAGVTLGSGGKTIGSVGCTTTCLAMCESYRLSKTVYPDAMSKLLSYSSSGSLYWPSNYVTSTSSDGYLQRIYNNLKSGKCVIIGCKKSTGAMHWVVVTGFSGNSVSAENFTINDPGSSYRTTLAQFMSVYPIFYKTAVYA